MLTNRSVNTRKLAVSVLCKVLQDGRSLTAALEQLNNELPVGKERAFTKLLCFGTIRWYFRLEILLSNLLKKPLKKKDIDIQILALLGLYQLAYTRVKPHAAVAETVSAVGKKTWAKPLLNALLRSYQRDSLTLDKLADQNNEGISAHPAWLVAEIRKSWPDQASEIFSQNNKQAPMILRVNRLHSTRDSYINLLKNTNIDATACTISDCAIQLSNPVEVKVLPGFNQGLVSIQDQAAQLAAKLLDLQRDQRVLDVCAAPGGKTLHILESNTELAEMLVVDIDAVRTQKIHENLQRARLSATVKVCDMSEPSEWWDNQLFDRILLDVPCSATGVIRRHPDIKIHRKHEDISGLCVVQHKLLDRVWKLLKSGGVLLYSTCSVLRAENEDQIKRFLNLNDDATEWVIDEEWGRKCTYGRQILPGDLNMDGFYYARLIKK